MVAGGVLVFVGGMPPVLVGVLVRVEVPGIVLVAVGGVPVTVAVGVCVSVGVLVMVGVFVMVGVLVTVRVCVTVPVCVAVPVCVTVGGVPVNDGVGGTEVGDLNGVRVAVGGVPVLVGVLRGRGGHYGYDEAQDRYVGVCGDDGYAGAGDAGFCGVEGISRTACWHRRPCKGGHDSL